MHHRHREAARHQRNARFERGIAEEILKKHRQQKEAPIQCHAKHSAEQSRRSKGDVLENASDLRRDAQLVSSRQTNDNQSDNRDNCQPHDEADSNQSLRSPDSSIS